MNANGKITNKSELEFVIFCIESVAVKLQVNAEYVYKALSNCNIISDYIVPCFETLHTQSKEYIVDDIIEVIKERDVKI